MDWFELVAAYHVESLYGALSDIDAVSNTTNDIFDVPGTTSTSFTQNQLYLVSNHPELPAVRWISGHCLFDNSSLNQLDNFTITAVCRPNTIGTTNTIFATTTCRVYLASGVFKAQYVVGGVLHTMPVGSAPTAISGRKYHVGLVHDGANLHLYVNETNVSNVAVGSLDGNTGKFVIAGNIDTFNIVTDVFNGEIGFIAFLRQALTADEIYGISQSTRTQSFNIAIAESLGVDGWGETDHAGLGRPQEIDESLWIDWDWTEEVDYRFRLVATPSISESITLTETSHIGGPLNFKDHETLTITDLLVKSGSDREFITEDFDEFDETYSLHGALSYKTKDIITFNENVRFTGIGLPYVIFESISTFTEKVGLEWGIANIRITDIFTLTEKVGLDLAIWSPRISETLIFTEQVARIKAFTITDTVTFTDSPLRTKDKAITDTLVITDGLSFLKVKPTSDILTFFEDACSKNVFSRPLTDFIAFSEHVNVWGSKTTTPVNNPTFVGYNDLTETEYNNLTEDQYNNLLLTTPEPNTGFVLFPFKRTIKIRESINFLETMVRIGGHAHCD